MTHPTRSLKLTHKRRRHPPTLTPTRLSPPARLPTQAYLASLRLDRKNSFGVPRTGQNHEEVLDSISVHLATLYSTNYGGSIASIVPKMQIQFFHKTRDGQTVERFIVTATMERAKDFFEKYTVVKPTVGTATYHLHVEAYNESHIGSARTDLPVQSLITITAHEPTTLGVAEIREGLQRHLNGITNGVTLIGDMIQHKSEVGRPVNRWATHWDPTKGSFDFYVLFKDGGRARSFTVGGTGRFTFKLHATFLETYRVCKVCYGDMAHCPGHDAPGSKPNKRKDQAEQTKGRQASKTSKLQRLIEAQRGARRTAVGALPPEIGSTSSGLGAPPLPPGRQPPPLPPGRQPPGPARAGKEPERAHRPAEGEGDVDLPDAAQAASSNTPMRTEGDADADLYPADELA